MEAGELGVITEVQIIWSVRPTASLTEDNSVKITGTLNSTGFVYCYIDTGTKVIKDSEDITLKEY